MIVILHPDVDEQSRAYRLCMDYLDNQPGVEKKLHKITGEMNTVTEIYLLGDTKSLNRREIEQLTVVDRVIRVAKDYRVLGRHSAGEDQPLEFEYNGVRFSQDTFHLFAGLCAVDNRENVKTMMAALEEFGQTCTRMGAYKPRTNPYSFQGHGKGCLPFVFEEAGAHGIRVISMEVTHESHIDEIHECLEKTGNPTGVMLQVGTRNTQNFELLKAIGRQNTYPVLLKRGFGITMNESLNAAEYLASEGNNKVIFCLRGMKTSGGDPHRNMVDFAHVPVVKRLTRMPVCVDPSHSVGSRERSPEGILDIMHATAQGIVAGANMVLVDFHPEPGKALVDGPQALRMGELKWYLEDIACVREAYVKRRALAAEHNA